MPVDLRGETRGRAEQLAGRVRAVGFGDDRDGGPARAPDAAGGTASACSAVAARSAPRSLQDVHRVAHLLGERRVGLRDARAAHGHHLHRADPGGRRVRRPTGPAPRSAAVRRRMRSAGTAARPGGSTLVGSHSRSAHERTAGSSTSACSQPSSCSQRASTRVAVDREVADAGEEREVEQLGELGTDLAGVGVDRVAAGEHEVERAFARERGGERLRGRERVGAGERGVGDVHAVDVDAAIESPRDRLAQRVVGGRRSEREHGDV